MVNLRNGCQPEPDSQAARRPDRGSEKVLPQPVTHRGCFYERSSAEVLASQGQAFHPSMQLRSATGTAASDYLTSSLSPKPI